MQHVPVHCPCGWDFFVDEFTSKVFCPRCTRFVQDLTPAPATGDIRTKIVVLACVGAGLIVLFLVLVRIVAGGGPDAGKERAATPTPERPAPVEDPTPVQPPPLPQPELPELPPPPETPPPPKIEPLAPELCRAVQARVLSLPAYYRDRCVRTDEIARAQALLKEGKGTSDDAVWMGQMPVLGAIQLAWKEIDKLKADIARLEPEAVSEPPPDTLVMKDGRTLHGRIAEEGTDTVKLERLVAGKPQRATFSRSDIKSVDKGKGPAAEALQRLERARNGNKVTDYLELMAWAKTKSYEKLRRLAQHLAVLREPGFDEMRVAIGLRPFSPPPRPLPKPGPTPEPVLEPESYDKDPLVFWEGRQLPARELRDLLLKEGYALFEGRWYTHADATYAVPDLFRYEKMIEPPVRLVGTLSGDFLPTYRPKYVETVGAWEEEEERTYTRKYYAPEFTVSTDLSRSSRAGSFTILRTDHLEPRDKPVLGQPQNAEVWLGINVNKPIIAGRIMALAEVDEGRITCDVFVDGVYHEVFHAAPHEAGTHPLPEVVRGRPELTLVFKMTCLARGRFVTEKRTLSGSVNVEHKRFCPQHRVRLFPSDGSAYEVFRADLIVGEPAPDLNNAYDLAGASHLLMK